MYYRKTCLKRPLPKGPRPLIGFQAQLSLNACQNYCRIRSILQYFRPSLSYRLSLRSLFYLVLSGRLRQVLLHLACKGVPGMDRVFDVELIRVRPLPYVTNPKLESPYYHQIMPCVQVAGKARWHLNSQTTNKLSSTSHRAMSINSLR